jgi:hypothetical protein
MFGRCGDWEAVLYGERRMVPRLCNEHMRIPCSTNRLCKRHQGLVMVSHGLQVAVHIHRSIYTTRLTYDDCSAMGLRIVRRLVAAGLHIVQRPCLQGPYLVVAWPHHNASRGELGDQILEFNHCTR